MKLRRNFAAAIFVILHGTSIGVAAQEFAAEMEAENSRWLAVYNSRDAQAFGPMYTPDAVLVPQGGEPIKGRTAIVQFWFKMLKNEFLKPTLEIVDLHQEGRLAYQTCRWTVLKPREGSSVKHLSGNTLRIFERQRDGRWLIKVQMSNTD
ncbi:MAG: SgcJ/EcaC family oxidoreductase [Pseudomonas sp.]|nr:MAG: SgcJ/EcaC family oxidoreductase [Pseudomonas sp.]